MSPGRTSCALGIVTVVVAVVVGAAWFALSPGIDVLTAGVGGGTSAAFAAAAIAGSLLVLEPPRSRPRTAAVAVLAALALLGGSPWQVAAVGVIGWLGATVLLRAAGREVRRADLPRVLLAGWSLPGVVALTHHVPGSAALPVGLPVTSVHHAAIDWIAIAAVIVAVTLGEAVWEACGARGRRGTWHLVRARLRTTWASSVALASSGAVVAVAYTVFGAGALLLLFLPLLAVQVGLQRHTSVRRMYDETVVAMSRMTELTGHVRADHGLRVSALAVGVARDLGLGDRTVERVERAGLLHEVGRILTDDPDERGQDREVALAGAAIVHEAGDMSGVATLIERHRDPYRAPGVDEDVSVPVAARIVRTACEYDRLVSGGTSSRHALDDLRRSMAYDHDPTVVRALARHVSGSTPP